MASTHKGTVRYVPAPAHPEARDAPGTGRPVNPVPAKGVATPSSSPDSKASRPASTQERNL
jgi:hypothetical protein